MFLPTWIWSIPSQISVLTARPCELVTDLSSVWWLESLQYLQHWSVQSSQEMGHFSGVWPLGTFIELGMALNILSSPSLGNGIGSDFQNKWKCICMLTLFHYRWKWISQKIVPDILQRRNFVPDQCCCNKPNCCYCYVEYIVKTMSHSLWTQHCMQYACMTAGPRTTAATVWQRSSSALRTLATALTVCCTLEEGLAADAKALFWWKLILRYCCQPATNVFTHPTIPPLIIS